MKQFTHKDKTVIAAEDGHVYFNGVALREHDNGNGYLTTSIKSKLFYVHRVIASAYHLNPENKRTVNHKNGNKKDNRPENLEWCTSSENNTHAHRVLKIPHSKNQLGKSGFNHQYSKPVDQVNKETGNVINTFGSICEAAKEMGVDPSAIANAIRGRNRMKYCKGFKWVFNENGNQYKNKFNYYYENGTKKRKLATT